LSSAPLALERDDAGAVGLDLDLKVGAEALEHAFAMVAGRDRLDHAGDAGRVEAGEQDRRLHLGRGDRQGVVERHGRAGAGHGQRQAIAGAGGEAGADAGEWFGNARHRALAEGRVAHEGGGDAMAGDQAHQQAGRGAAIAHVERFLRLEQAADADAMNMPDAVIVTADVGAHGAPTAAIGGGYFGNFRAHGAKGGRGGQHILALQQAFDPAFAHGQGGQHQRTVGNALVARNRDAAGQGRGGGEGHRAGLVIMAGHGVSIILEPKKCARLLTARFRYGKAPDVSWPTSVAPRDFCLSIEEGTGRTW